MTLGPASSSDIFLLKGFILSIIIVIASALSLQAGIGDFEDHLKYADSLFSESDYFRALSEYKTIEFFFPKRSSESNVQERICRTFLKAGRWFDLDNYLLDQRQRTENMIFMSGVSAFKQGKYDISLKILEKINPGKTVPGRKELLFLLKAVDLAQMGRYRETGPLLESAGHGDNIALESAVRIKKGIEYVSARKPRDPVMAGVFSIVPGAGMIYAGHIPEGLGTLLAGSVGIFGAVQNIETKDWLNLTIWATAFLAFYVNNFNSAIKFAEEYNRKLDGYLPALMENDLTVKSFYDRNTSTQQPGLKIGLTLKLK